MTHLHEPHYCSALTAFFFNKSGKFRRKHVPCIRAMRLHAQKSSNVKLIAPYSYFIWTHYLSSSEKKKKRNTLKNFKPSSQFDLVGRCRIIAKFIRTREDNLKGEFLSFKNLNFIFFLTFVHFLWYCRFIVRLVLSILQFLSKIKKRGDNAELCIHRLYKLIWRARGYLGRKKTHKLYP